MLGLSLLPLAADCLDLRAETSLLFREELRAQPIRVVELQKLGPSGRTTATIDDQPNVKVYRLAASIGTDFGDSSRRCSS